MNHQHNVIKAEFSRQAEQIVSAPSFNDEDTLVGLVEAVKPTRQDRVLDVACGTGVVTFRLAKMAKEVIGLDLTGEMLQRARKQRHDRGVENVRFALGEAEALPFESGTFDTVVCRMSLHHFSDPQRAIAEMVRVTRPGGRVVLADIVTSSSGVTARLHNAIERLRDPSHVRMLNREELLDMVARNGLQVQKTTTWEKKRFFQEWADILNAPERSEPLKVVLEALAASSFQTGIALCLDEHGSLQFKHTWLLVTAQKPKTA